MSKIDFSFLAGKIYLVNKSKKEDITNEVVKAVQILLHNGKEFDLLVSKLDNKTFKLKLEEVNEKVKKINEEFNCDTNLQSKEDR